MAILINQANYVTPPIATTGLILQLDAGNTLSYPRSGTTWRDLSTASNTGTLNSLTYSTTVGGSFIFPNATTSYVTVPNTNSTLTFGTGNFTLECWFNTNGGTQATNSTLISLGTVGAANNWQLNFTSNLLVFFYNNVNNIGTTFNATTSTVWNQAVVVRSSTGAGGTAIYINGIINVTGTAATNFTDTNGVKIGLNRPSNAAYNGSIALARAYNVALSAQQVAQNYNALKNRFGLL